jgi:DNA polymerase (family 10)
MLFLVFNDTIDKLIFSMKNQEIARIFNDISSYLRMDEVQFKPYAYEKGAAALEGLKDDVGKLYLDGGMKALLEIPGIGKALAGHIEEYLKTGKIEIYEEYKKKLPLKMDELLKVDGMGPKKIRTLYQKLGVTDLKSLKKAVTSGKVAPLAGFGKKTEENILQGLDFLSRSKGRSLIHDILPAARSILAKLEALPEVKKATIAGSLRRRKETIGDVDFLVVATDAKKVMDFFCELPDVEKIWGKGGTKASVHLTSGYDMDLRVLPEKSYGSALQYFTGSKDHNIMTRKIAIQKGLKLSEWGMFDGAKQIAGKNEEEVYRALGMDCPPPEIRENEGEIEAALAGKLPKLVELSHIKGDLHVHSNWGEPEGKKHSVEDLAEYAMGLGYEYLGISDHTNELNVERSLNEKELLEQHAYIQAFNEKLKKQGKKFRVLHGCEANIRKDGSIDVKDEVLAQLDYVIAGVHSLLKLPKKEMMARLKKAMENPHVDIIAHPTGRIVGQRDEYEHDFDAILEIAKKTGTILEINSSSRLDLRDLYIRRAKNAGVKMIINTDAHVKEHLNFMEYGVSQARRGWAERGDIVNTNSIEKLLEYFN